MAAGISTPMASGISQADGFVAEKRDGSITPSHQPVDSSSQLPLDLGHLLWLRSRVERSRYWRRSSSLIVEIDRECSSHQLPVDRIGGESPSRRAHVDVRGVKRAALSQRRRIGSSVTLQLHLSTGKMANLM